MSRSATPATRNEATRRLKLPKRTTSAKLPIGTAIRSSHERLRTVADAEATSSEHTLNPQTPRVKREPLLRIREKRAFRARLPPMLIFSTCYQTGWNVTKCHACHAKRHDNLLGNIRKGQVFQLPP